MRLSFSSHLKLRAKKCLYFTLPNFGRVEFLMRSVPNLGQGETRLPFPLSLGRKAAQFE